VTNLRAMRPSWVVGRAIRCSPHDSNATLVRLPKPDGGQRSARPTFPGPALPDALGPHVYGARGRPFGVREARSRFAKAAEIGTTELLSPSRRGRRTPKDSKGLHGYWFWRLALWAFSRA
jgi:hypothetical protein